MAKLSAHRGGPEGRYPPNRLATIAAACELGVDLIEFDVRVTRDDRFVIQHDADTRIRRRRHAVSDLDAADLLRADDPAVELQAVLAVIAGRAMGHVDLKDDRCEVEIADLCVQALGPDGFVLTTGIDASVRRLRLARPELRVGLSLGRTSIGVGRVQVLLPRWSEIFPRARVAGCDANLLALNHQLARLGVLRWAHRRGLPVLVWTLNSPRLIQWAQGDARVWAYTTDWPRRARAIMQSSS